MNCQRCGKKLGTYLCSVCKRLVCSDCEIIKDEKVYCLDHVPKEVVLAIKPKREINRPLGISIIAVSGIIFALISIFVILFVSMFVSLSELLSSTETESILGLNFLSIIALIIAFIQFAVSYGLWNMKRWALYAQIAVYIINFVLNFSEISLTPYVLVLVLMILSLIIFYLLYKRKLFSQPKGF